MQRIMKIVSFRSLHFTLQACVFAVLQKGVLVIVSFPDLLTMISSGDPLRISSTQLSFWFFSRLTDAAAV